MAAKLYICNKVAIFLAKHFTIRQSLAGFMLIVFSFSVTPKKFLHDAIANHTDKAAFVGVGNQAQLSHAGFICKCDNLVAESPFTDTPMLFDLAPVFIFPVKQESSLYHFYPSACFFFELRGPPVSDNTMI